PGESVAKDVAGPRQRAEQVSYHGEATVADAGEVDGRPLGLVHPPHDTGGLQVRVYLLFDTNQLTRPLLVARARSHAPIPHVSPPGRRAGTLPPPGRRAGTLAPPGRRAG